MSDDAIFEGLFQLWLEEGGPKQQVLREDLEREMREDQMTVPRPKAVCPHGSSPLTCAQCYFQK